MDNILLLGLVAIIVAGGVFIIERRLRHYFSSKQAEAGMMMLNQNVQGMQSRIDETTKAINTRLDRAAEVIQGVNKELGQVQEIGRSMKDLQDFLRSPKLRGNIGEQVMKDLLEQYFPRVHFDIQWQFQSGERVDAILKTDKGLIPIDAKFPMENFQKMMKTEVEAERDSARKDFVRDVKKHITDIAKKYILPAENTVDFALMYIPSESVYYELIHDDSDLNTFAQAKRVFPVSPNSFYYFLKVVMIGLEGKHIEEASRKILETLKAIQQDAIRFGDQLGTLTGHVTNSKNSIDRVNAEYVKLAGKIDDVRLLK
jgi:DNA recombination protein RmuC